MTKTHAAGGVVLSDTKKILVVNQNGNSWSFPKGHIDKGETDLQAAMREIHEESGLVSPKLIKRLGFYERYRLGLDPSTEDKSELKHITMFLFTSTEAPLRPIDSNNPEARWVSIEELPSLLTHPKDAEFFLSIKPELHVLSA